MLARPPRAGLTQVNGPSPGLRIVFFMDLPLQITLRGVPRSDALDAAIREKAAKLQQFYDHIASCRVVVEVPGRHQHQGKQFVVRVDLKVPGQEIAVNRDHHEDVYVALRDAFDAARRQLQDFAREQRGDVKAHAPEQAGRVARVDLAQGFGFIATPDGRELYFSRDNVVTPPFEHLAPGTEVHFIEEAAAEGLQAKRVSAHRGAA